jgi:hypothetical protein
VTLVAKTEQHILQSMFEGKRHLNIAAVVIIYCPTLREALKLHVVGLYVVILPSVCFAYGLT